jgi:hypothetical protein
MVFLKLTKFNVRQARGRVNVAGHKPKNPRPSVPESSALLLDQ